jgi:hypothetical protein
MGNTNASLTQLSLSPAYPVLKCQAKDRRANKDSLLNRKRRSKLIDDTHFDQRLFSGHCPAPEEFPIEFLYDVYTQKHALHDLPFETEFRVSLSMKNVVRMFVVGVY